VLGQVATVPHVVAAFFLVATLNAIVECTRAASARRANALLAAAVVLYLLALMSNESMAGIFPALGLAFLVFDERADGRWRRAIVRSAPFAAIGCIVALAVKTCDCTEASSVYSLENAHRGYLIYAGRLLYPVGLEPPTYINAPHLYAAGVLLALSGWMLTFGPTIGRVGVVWMLLAIVPHIFVADHTANRFTYLATPGFAMLAGGYLLVLEQRLRRVSAVLPLITGVAVLVVVAPWYAWETHVQNDPWQQTTAGWHQLHDELQRVYPSVPPGERVEIVSGTLVRPLDNFFVMPSLGWTIWGLQVTLQAFAPDDPYVAKLRASPGPYVAEFRDGRLVPLAPR
jgi:hypothetical protein